MKSFIKGSLEVWEDSLFKDVVITDTDVHVGGCLYVDDCFELIGSMSVSGDTNIFGDANISGNLDIGGLATFSVSGFTIPTTTKISNLNADYLDGYHSSSFLLDSDAQTNYVRKSIAGTISAQHTFSYAGSPFVVNNSTLVSNLNADYLDGYHSSSFLLGSDAQSDYVRKAVAGTISAQHTFSHAGAPFIVNNSTLVSNLNADYLDGNHASAFVSSSDLASYVPKTVAVTISANHIFSGDPIFSSNPSFTNFPVLTGTLLFTSAGTGWKMYQSGTDFKLDYNTTNQFKITSAGKIFGKEADFDGFVYVDELNTSNHGSGAVKTLRGRIAYSDAGTYADLTCNSFGTLQVSPAGGGAMLYVGTAETITMNNTFKVANGSSSGDLYCYEIHSNTVHGTVVAPDMTIDTSLPENNIWDIIGNAVTAYSAHDVSKMHEAVKVKSFKKQIKKGFDYKNAMTEDFEDVPVVEYCLNDLVQITVECIAELKTEIDILKGV